MRSSVRVIDWTLLGGTGRGCPVSPKLAHTGRWEVTGAVVCRKMTAVCLLELCGSSPSPVRRVSVATADTDGRPEDRESTAGGGRRGEVSGRAPIGLQLPEEGGGGVLSCCGRRTPHLTWGDGR